MLFMFWYFFLNKSSFWCVSSFFSQNYVNHHLKNKVLDKYNLEYMNILKNSYQVRYGTVRNGIVKWFIEIADTRVKLCPASVIS
jgi:hypothetical protein